MKRYVSADGSNQGCELPQIEKRKLSHGFRPLTGSLIVLLLLVAAVTLPSLSASSKRQAQETRDSRTNTLTTDLRSAMKTMKLKEGDNVVHKGAGHTLIALVKGGKVVDWKATDDNGNPLHAEVLRAARCKVCVTTYPSPGVPRETCYEIDCKNLPPPLDVVGLTPLPPSSQEAQRKGRPLVNRLPQGAEGVELNDGMLRLKPGFKFVTKDNNTVTVARMSGGSGVKGTWSCFCNSLGAGGTCKISTIGPTLLCREGTCSDCEMSIDVDSVRTRIIMYHAIK